MITSIKTILKKKTNKTERKRTDRTLGQMVKAKLYRQNHTQTYTYTCTKREKGNKIYISLLPKSTSSICDDSLSIQVFHRCRVHQVDCGDLICCSCGCWEIFPFLFFVHTALGFRFVFGPTSTCSSPEGVSYFLREDGVKGSADWGLWLTQAGGRDGYGVWGEPAVAEAGVQLHQCKSCCVFLRGSCSWITGPWQWRAAQAPGRGGVDSDMCLHTGFLVAAAAALASHGRLWGPC